MEPIIIKGLFTDIEGRSIYPCEIQVEKGKITSVQKIDEELEVPPYFILPGFIDAHVHIESSMLVPSEFARLAVVHGTVGTVSDPHEIANVCGLEGVDYMIANGATVPFKFNFGAPSCVPATLFETAGAELNAGDVDALLQRKEIRYLSEMMNFPGVLHRDEEVMKKIASAKKWGKPVDGHAPGLRGADAQQYINAGISTDHECFTEEEARDKLEKGMKILIREGSAAKNFDALIPLLNEYPEHMMFCSDDKHPDSLVEGHINELCARAIAKNIDLFHVLQAACINPVTHYKLGVGLLREGDPADFILVKDLTNFEVYETYINGQVVARNGKSLVGKVQAGVVNRFSCNPKKKEDFRLEAPGVPQFIPVIEALDGQLITNKLMLPPKIEAGSVVSDTEKDVLKIVVVNRYKDAPVAIGFIRNFGLKSGAIASSVAHDSHNIVAVGTDDEQLCVAVNSVIGTQGGISIAAPGLNEVLPLPVAGLMTHADGYEVAKAYSLIDGLAKSLGSTLASPFMTLSFMALLVIPHLKLSDRGMFDGDRFALV
jgi:adenine deaminase